MKRREFLKSTAAVAGTASLGLPRIAAAQAMPDVINVGHLVGICMSPLFYAQATGLFAAEGLKVDMKFMPNPGDALTALTGNVMQIVHIPFTNIIVAANNGAPVRIVGGSGAASAPDSGGSEARFSGSSMCVGPGFSSRAILKALRTISGMAGIRSIRAFHFVTGLNMSTTSTTWWASLWSLSDDAWPVMATAGARSRYASAMPVRRLVAPGPSVAIATAARPVSRP